MIVEYSRYVVPIEMADQFVAAWHSAIRPMRTSGHVHNCEVAQSVAHPTNWTVRAEWDSVSGHQEGFQRGPQYAIYRQLLAPFDGFLIENGHYERRMEFGELLMLSA